jgi:7,8-dihydropterin-6-yl-methyl-4-(beta-D-ribofuranosyl)aminobenzene 5'-phosphate synthase
MLVRNAEVLGADLSGLSAVVLSHGHYDHTGGLDAVLEVAPGEAPVHAHPAATAPKYAVSAGGEPREIGFRGGPEAAGRLKLSREPVEVVPGVRTTGQVPRVTTFEDTGGPFFLDPGGLEPDPLFDDQSLLVEAAGGHVLIAGCAHSGIVNTLRHARDLAGGGRFLAVLGGMHLAAASEQRLSATTLMLREMDVAAVGPAHCTGEAVCSRMAGEFGERFRHCAAGTVLRF